MTTLKMTDPKTLSGEELAEVATLLGQYKAAKATQRASEEIAKGAHDRLCALLGDAEVGVDADGLPVFRAPWRERRTISVDEALAIAPIVATVMKTTRYRVIA